MRSAHGSSLAPSLQERGRLQAPSAAINFSGFHLRTSHDSNELAFGVHHAHRGNRKSGPKPIIQLGEAGFSLTRVIPTAGSLSIIES
jgi:hypothetical protein